VISNESKEERVYKTNWLLLATVAALGISAFGKGNWCLLPSGNKIPCKNGVNKINGQGLSQGGKMWYYGPQTGHGSLVRKPTGTSTYPNVDAAKLSEDLAGGQAETAIAAAGQKVMAVWNDATGFFVFPSTTPQASLTGVGFSRNGGASFTDLVGLPNNNPNQQWYGDPSVVAVDNGAFFIVSSMYLPVGFDCTQGPVQFAIAVSVATVTQNNVEFTNPIVAASTGDGCTTGQTGILDKDFMRYDPKTRTLAITFTDFTFFGFGSGQIELVTAKVPLSPPFLSSADFSAPIVVWPEEPGVENEGSYPALAVLPPGSNSSTIFVSWERNWFTNQFNGDPYVYIYAAEVRGGVVTAGGPGNPVVVTLGQANSTALGGVKSMDLEQIVGYNRFNGNDFPRIAWDSARNRVAIVWNDASHHPLGDIFMRAYSPGLTNPGAILRINSDTSGALHFMPAVCFLSDGSMVTSWYDRRNYGPSSSVTDYWGDIRPAPYAAANNFVITTVATDWNATGSIITPNFGDYTDNACTGTQAYFTWSDGRLGVPQPFVAP
jgi:hypothetical protein